jgi:hypothetical protein
MFEISGFSENCVISYAFLLIYAFVYVEDQGGSVVQNMRSYSETPALATRTEKGK